MILFVRISEVLVEAAANAVTEAAATTVILAAIKVANPDYNVTAPAKLPVAVTAKSELAGLGATLPTTKRTSAVLAATA